MNELILLSGGVESTGVLYHRLVDTPNNLYVLHVRRNTNVSGPALTIAARKIVIWLAKKVRMFEYFEFTPMELAGKPCANSMVSSAAFAAGEIIVRNPEIQVVVHGTNGDPLDQTEESIFMNKYRENLCAAVCNGFAPAPKWIYPHINMSKVDIWKKLPEELRSLTWSCTAAKRVGENFVQCGECPKCLEIKRMKEIFNARA
jgi:7-cyano-7-deazaguanine synthase in queuosine biosynthesis